MRGDAQRCGRCGREEKKNNKLKIKMVGPTFDGELDALQKWRFGGEI
jgi:hypothetical protein